MKITQFPLKSGVSLQIMLENTSKDAGHELTVALNRAVPGSDVTSPFLLVRAKGADVTEIVRHVYIFITLHKDSFTAITSGTAVYRGNQLIDAVAKRATEWAKKHFTRKSCHVIIYDGHANPTKRVAIVKGKEAILRTPWKEEARHRAKFFRRH